MFVTLPHSLELGIAAHQGERAAAYIGYSRPSRRPPWILDLKPDAGFPATLNSRPVHF